MNIPEQVKGTQRCYGDFVCDHCVSQGYSTCTYLGTYRGADLFLHEYPDGLTRKASAEYAHTIHPYDLIIVDGSDGANEHFLPVHAHDLGSFGYKYYLVAENDPYVAEAFGRASVYGVLRERKTDDHHESG